MGCTESKVDDLPLVTLCRERKNLIRAASENRYALAAAHISYFQSLASVGNALCKFVEEELVIGANSGSYPSSPVMTLPSDERKTRRSSGKVKNSSSAALTSHSASYHAQRGVRGSHLDLSGTDSDSGSDLNTHSGHIHLHDSPPVRKAAEARHVPDPGPSFSYDASYFYPYQNPFPYQHPQGEWEMPNMAPDISESHPRMYYMKKSVAPMKSVIFEKPERYSVRENESWSRYENSVYPQHGTGGYFGYLMSNEPGCGISNDIERQKQEQTPPAPPSPPRVSPWEYLNVFDTYGNANVGYYPLGSTMSGSRISSPDSVEVREREGIPDLEDETETETEMMKVVYRDGKKRGGNTMQKKKYNNIPNKVPLQKNRDGPSNFSLQQNEGYPKVVPSIGGESSHLNFAKEMERICSENVLQKVTSPEVHARKRVSFEVEEPPVEEIESMKPNLTALSAKGTRELQEVVQEIKNEFETAYSYGKEVAFLLEVGKVPYQSKETLLKELFSRILRLVSPSMASSEPPFEPSVSPRTMKMTKAYCADAKDNLMAKSGNISSTLVKLYEWERKLHKEVKDEEKLRVVYMKQCKKLKSLDDKGAESAKIDATRASIRKLHTKINVSLRTVDAISNRIHKLRDEELQPQLIELIHGLIRMWRSIFKCHQKQFQAIMESKARSLLAKRESSLRATLELEVELLNWCESFNQWVTTQRTYIKSLNEWLLRCHNHKLEETTDGVTPFSPPPIFVICNDWFQAMERISQERVSTAMRDFASRLHELWERQDEEVKTETVSNDIEKQLRILRREKGKLQKHQEVDVVPHLDDLKVDLDSLRKKMEEGRERHKETVKLVRGPRSVQSGLVPIFETLGSFSSEVLKGYEHVRIGN